MILKHQCITAPGRLVKPEAEPHPPESDFPDLGLAAVLAFLTSPWVMLTPLVPVPLSAAAMP